MKKIVSGYQDLFKPIEEALNADPDGRKFLETMAKLEREHPQPVPATPKPTDLQSVTPASFVTFSFYMTMGIYVISGIVILWSFKNIFSIIYLRRSSRFSTPFHNIQLTHNIQLSIRSRKSQ